MRILKMTLLVTMVTRLAAWRLGDGCDLQVPGGSPQLAALLHEMVSGTALDQSVRRTHPALSPPHTTHSRDCTMLAGGDDQYGAEQLAVPAPVACRRLAACA